MQRGATLMLRSMRSMSTTAVVSEGPTHYANSLGWVMAGCPSPASAMPVKPKPVAIEAPKVAVEEAVKKAVASGEASSLPMMIMAGFSVLQIARYNFLNPTKDAGGAVAYSIDADGKMEKLEAEEEAEFELPKEFENPEEGKRYGGAFKAREVPADEE